MDDPERLKLQMMAFLDDELPHEERLAFTRQCAVDRALATELAKYRRLHDITNSMRLREPEDHEIERFYAQLSARLERGIALWLIAAGLLGLAASCLYYLTQSALPLAIRLSLGSLSIGGCMLTWHLCRLRLRLRHLDRYHGVVR